MKTRFALIVGAIVIAAAYVVISFTGTSVNSSGQFSRLEDGTILYTHQLTNLTWHPIRYSIAADPDSPVATTLIRWDSSDPEHTVTRMASESGSSPWSVTVNVPGRQEASIEVVFELSETLASPGLTATRDSGGTYPAVKVLLSVEK
ncbi:MAG: hypothetical protein ACM3WU_05230 [Bacillota bacterium]